MEQGFDLQRDWRAIVFLVTAFSLVVFLVPWIFSRYKRTFAVASAVVCVAWYASYTTMWGSKPFFYYAQMWLMPMVIGPLLLWTFMRHRRSLVVLLPVLCALMSWLWYMGMENHVVSTAIWLLPMFVCALAWPMLRRSRVRIVTAAIVCLTPAVVFTPLPVSFLIQLWPLIFIGFAELLLGPVSENALTNLVAMVFPMALPIGVIAWLLCEKYLPPPNNPSANSEAEIKPRPVRDQ